MRNIFLYSARTIQPALRRTTFFCISVCPPTPHSHQLPPIAAICTPSYLVPVTPHLTLLLPFPPRAHPVQQSFGFVLFLAKMLDPKLKPKRKREVSGNTVSDNKQQNLAKLCANTECICCVGKLDSFNTEHLRVSLRLFAYSICVFQITCLSEKRKARNPHHLFQRR